MTARGVVYKDLLPVADDTPAVTNPEKREVAQALGEKPTASHALAVEAVKQPDQTGAAQVDHDADVVDLGWNEPPDKVPKPLVGGLPNEELWLLVRRFNKQIYHVKEYPYAVPGGLDLNIAEEEKFSPDKLRANFERLYMTVIIGIIATIKHMARLRSWRETRRTAWFCTAYFIAWMFDFLVPLFSAVLIALIVYPPAREALFPPAPIALVDGKSGGVQKPKAGVLGSHDSATGAPENHKGEAVEAEASNFVNSIAALALSSASGKHPQNDPPSEEGTAQDSVPDPTAIAMSAANAKEKAGGGKPSAAHDKTKVPMETAMWTKMRPFMHGVATVADYWERFGNALSPTPPFPRDKYRLRLAALVVPMLGTSLFVSSYMFTKGVTFGVGFGFFGDPIIQPAFRWLNREFPNWKKLLELRNNILRGVPTDAQLTLTLLRIGEANHAPLPPPPRPRQPPPEKPAEVTDQDLRATGADYPLNATKEELDAAMEHDPKVAHQTGGSDIDASKQHHHGKKGSKLLSFFKTTTKATVETALGADKLKAKAGSEHAKNRLGAIPPPDEGGGGGPGGVKCRYHGKKGHAYVVTKTTTPFVAFTTDSTVEKLGTLDRDDLHPVWRVPIADIKELKKIGGFGWKAKLLVGWALDREVADGIEIVDRKGNTWVLTAMLLRDELFNRLIAIDGQKWEAW